MEAHIAVSAGLLGVTLSVLDASRIQSEGFPYPIESFTRLINAPYLLKLFGEEPGADVLDPENVLSFLTYDKSKTIIAESIPKGPGDKKELKAFVVFGDFVPSDDGDDSWPSWKSKDLPKSNKKFAEIKLLGAEHGFGRPMFALALLKCSQITGREACVLEVLGVKHNKLAVGLYKSFGFVHEIAYDWTSGPTFQCRDAMNGSLVIMFMVKRANSNGLFLSKEELEQNLSLEYLRKKGSVPAKEAGTPIPVPKKEINLRTSAELVATRRSTRQRLQKAAPNSVRNEVLEKILPSDSSEENSETESEDEDFELAKRSSHSKNSKRAITPKRKANTSARVSEASQSPSYTPPQTSGNTRASRSHKVDSFDLSGESTSNNSPTISKPNYNDVSDSTILSTSSYTSTVESEEAKRLKELFQSGFILEAEYLSRLSSLTS